MGLNFHGAGLSEMDFKFHGASIDTQNFLDCGCSFTIKTCPFSKSVSTCENLCPILYWHVLARDHIGESGYRQVLAEREAEDQGKLAESVDHHGPFAGKMTQTRLFD